PGGDGASEIEDADGGADEDAGQHPADEQRHVQVVVEELPDQPADRPADDAEPSANQPAQDSLEPRGVEDRVDDPDRRGDPAEQPTDDGGAESKRRHGRDARTLDERPDETGRPASAQGTVVDEESEGHGFGFFLPSPPLRRRGAGGEGASGLAEDTAPSPLTP